MGECTAAELALRNGTARASSVMQILAGHGVAASMTRSSPLQAVAHSGLPRSLHRGANWLGDEVQGGKVQGGELQGEEAAGNADHAVAVERQIVRRALAFITGRVDLSTVASALNALSLSPGSPDGALHNMSLGSTPRGETPGTFLSRSRLRICLSCPASSTRDKHKVECGVNVNSFQQPEQR